MTGPCPAAAAREQFARRLEAGLLRLGHPGLQVVVEETPTKAVRIYEASDRNGTYIIAPYDMHDEGTFESVLRFLKLRGEPDDD